MPFLFLSKRDSLKGPQLHISKMRHKVGIKGRVLSSPISFRRSIGALQSISSSCIDTCDTELACLGPPASHTTPTRENHTVSSSNGACNTKKVTVYERPWHESSDHQLSSAPKTQLSDWFYGWYCCWISAGMLAVLKRCMVKLKGGDSIGFASDRLGGWTVMGDPADPTGWCKLVSVRQVQTVGRILYCDEWLCADQPLSNIIMNNGDARLPG